MLQKAALKISLEEPIKKLLEMVSLLHHYGTKKIHLIHVRTKTSFRRHEQLEIQLEAIREEIERLGFSAHAHIRTGHAASAFMDMAEELRVDYVALYWMPKAVLKQALLGSIDSDILRMTNLPIFIHNHKFLRPVKELGSVLYATDFKFTDGAAMPYLINEQFRAHTLYLLHVGRRAPDPMTEQRREEHVRTNLQRLAQECAHAYDNVEVIGTIGFVRSKIVKHARSKNVDLIVVGKSERPDAMSKIVGSTAEILPHKSPCSVFIIPSICTLPNQPERNRS
ncbi:universal stress protein [Desulfoplanes sp.]